MTTTTMKLRDLISQLEAYTLADLSDAEVQVNDGEEVTDIRVVFDTRRRVQLLTDREEADDE